MIYAFTGKKQSGKSTACEYVESRLNDSVRINFKDGLYRHISYRYPDFVQALCQLLEKHYWDGKPWTLYRLNIEKPDVWRRFVQNKGTNDARKDDPDVWIKEYERSVKTLNRDIITDDVRFLNEAQMIRKLGGVIIRIIRDDLVSNDTHASEIEMDDIQPHYTIHTSTGKFEQLNKDIDTIINDTNQRSVI